MTQRQHFREHKPVTNVTDFLSAIKDARSFFPSVQHRGDDDILWFRGQHCIDWDLTPKLYRDEFNGAFEAEIINIFQSRGIQLLNGRQPVNKWEWYFLMQHHGAPTRLLDWTESPLVALFFAVKNHNRKEDAVVWLLAPYWLNGQNSFLKNRGIQGAILPSWSEADHYLIDLESMYDGNSINKKFPAAIEAPHVDARLHAQASRFVVFGKQFDLTNFFEIENKEFGLGRIPIPRASVKFIEGELAQLGIHAASIFPDIGGLGEFVCDQWRNHASK